MTVDQFAALLVASPCLVLIAAWAVFHVFAEAK